MSAHPGVVGVFGALDAAVAAIESLKAKGYANYRVYSPVPRPELADALAKKESPVRLFTLFGALTGTAFGFFYAIATSLDWPLVTGGKPIVSIPPFVIVIFEVTVLIGSLTNLAAVSVGGWLGGRAVAFPPAAAFSGDRIGVHAGGGDAAAAERILRSAGAEEVTRA